MVINPTVYESNGRGMDIFSKNLSNRIVHLVGEVNDEMAAVVTAQILQLDAESNEDIYLYINSPGGSVSAGLAILDTMDYVKSDVATICIGRAASMGAVLLSNGTKGKRCVLPHSEVMIHQPSGGMEGQVSEILIASDHIRETKKVLNKILSDNCNRPIKKVEKDTDRDYWMKAEDAVEYGIADKVLKGGDR
ncbi:MAG: ATP-dependent Clp protease proteolytic subunit [Lachnospiraceae bacterium]|nr:ATP-dependent Clp protease proteolytic subunit [Lachnospiraceae bacterium]